jgi:ParB-like chromosome segregation protein Spo0J
MDQRQISFCAVGELNSHPRNARKHSQTQIRDIAKSIEAFRFNAPVLIDKERRILAGHGRVDAAKLLGWKQDDS